MRELFRQEQERRQRDREQRDREREREREKERERQVREREREMQQQQQQQQRRAQKRSNYDAGNPREEWGEAKRQAMQYDATTSRYKGGLAANRYYQANIKEPFHFRTL